MVQKSHRLVLINDREVDSDTARYRPTLISDELRLAKQKFGHALCLCRTPPLKLIIRERGGTVHLACWPDESYLHSSDCAFYTEHYSGARSEGLVVDGENKTHATYHQPWIADSDGSKTKQGESVKLWALLHHLWESSRLYCWVPGWQRNWAIAQRVLTRAAKRTVVNGESLADHIYIPAPFAHSRKEEIQVEWSQFVDPIRSMHRGQGKRATGFILGEVRSLKPVGQGFLLCLKHHGPGVHIGPLMAKNLTHIARRGWVELTQPASQPDRSMSVVALLRVEALADGLLVAADCVLMRTSNLIPSNCQVEDELIGRLMKEGREFVRPLSYRQAALDLPVIVLHDVHRGPVEMHILGRGMAPHAAYQRIKQLEDAADQSKAMVWIWNRNATTMPELPEATAKRAA